MMTTVAADSAAERSGAWLCVNEAKPEWVKHSPMTGNNHYDVIVVGGGPAGSTAAYHLAHSGSLDVLVVDKSSFPRHKTCGGALPRCRDWSKELPNYSAIKEQIQGHPLNQMHLYVDQDVWWKGHGAHFADQVHRYEFDDLLLQAALEKPGVSFRVFQVKSLERLENGRIRLSDGNDSIEARAVIGADGVNGVVSTALNNPKRTKNEAGVCRVHHLVCEKPHENAFVFYLWAKDLGYCWLFPTSDGYNLGAGFMGPARKRAKQHLSDLLAYCVENGLVPRKHEIYRTSGALAPTTIVRNIAEDGILLVGDAAGLLNQLNGEGIYYAMRSGQLAGRILAESFEQAASRYRRAVGPLLKEVTYVKTIRPRIFHRALSGYFGAVKLGGILGLDGPLRRPFVNQFFRRNNLPEGSHYQKLR
jgi:menaquinone-9 beta-reductase